ncbi:phage Gp37/Gp68 family protein [Paraburkholderia tagetis]|uniref:Phage Gp37/Gp68 family protein n=1 Tax=Paraburkholderia tagetis TaxID=2913261 RepID=A0A9X1UL33_9BURK|nr:phage Gp37/Gp68 family protein [Paraburkholderia tagetis]MCG5077276.1 phage Gp37/Gp68 family protein [Paraburkholderia tagetis]
MENTTIEWADHTFNPFIGCTKVSPGCDHCYAEQLMDKRLHKVVWGAGQERIRTSTATWREPVRWNAQHAEFVAAHGRRQRVFCASLADVFDNEVPEAWRADLFDLIDRTPNLDWLLLTKRVGNVMRMINETATRQFDLERLHEPRLPDNVWIGPTMINRDEMFRDADKLLAVPARVRFWSVEPMLGDLGEIPLHLMPDWVICGGESGPHARPMHPDWVRDFRDQCAKADVAFLFKQWGEWAPGENCGGHAMRDARTAEWLGNGWHFDATTSTVAECLRHDDTLKLYRYGKKLAGRKLDGRTYDDFPKTSGSLTDSLA